MLLKVLNTCGCRKVYLAGFDGFSENVNNYYSENYTREEGKNVTVDLVKQIFSNTLDELEMHFITPSLYENK